MSVQLPDLLQFAIEQANDGIAIMKFTGDPKVPVRIVYANEEIERLSGYSREELLDPSNPFLQIQPQNRARYEALFREVRAGRRVRFEIELGGKGRSTWTEIRWSPLQYKDRTDVTHYVAVLRDMSQQRRAQKEHELLYQMIEQSRDGVCILDIPDGDPRRRRVTYANDVICALMGRTRERILSEGLAAPIFAGNPDLLEEYMSDVARGATFEHDVRAERDDGSERWLHVTASPIVGENGRVEQLVVRYRDVDDRRRESDELAMFHSMLSKTSDFILTTDATRPSQGGPVITYANAAFAALVGREQEQVAGASLVEFLSPRNDEIAFNNVIAKLERYESISHELRVCYARDNSDRWIELTGQQMRNESGHAVSWLFIGKDISVRKQSYMQTAQLMTALDLAEEPIAIYDVTGPVELTLQHMNERAAQLEGGPIIEKLLAEPSQRERLISAKWSALEIGKTVNRLIHVGDHDPRQWVTLEIRPMSSGRSMSSIVVIERPVQLALSDGPTGHIAKSLALGREILSYPDLEARRDAFIEVLRTQWGAEATFRRGRANVDILLRVKDRNGHVIMPPGVLFDQSVTASFAWFNLIQPRELTALRIFLETLCRSN